MQAISLVDLEIIVVLGFGTLQLDVLGDHVVRDIATRCHEVPTCPEVPTPELLAQRPKVTHQMMRGLTLDGLHHSARGKTRWHIQEQVHVVRADVPLQDGYVVAATNLLYQLLQPLSHVAPQDRLAVLRDEHEVVVQEAYRMRGPSVVAHPSIVPQAS